MPIKRKFGCWITISRKGQGRRRQLRTWSQFIFKKIDCQRKIKNKTFFNKNRTKKNFLKNKLKVGFEMTKLKTKFVSNEIHQGVLQKKMLNNNECAMDFLIESKPIDQKNCWERNLQFRCRFNSKRKINTIEMASCSKSDESLPKKNLKKVLSLHLRWLVTRWQQSGLVMEQRRRRKCVQKTGIEEENTTERVIWWESSLDSNPGWNRRSREPIVLAAYVEECKWQPKFRCKSDRLKSLIPHRCWQLFFFL